MKQIFTSLFMVAAAAGSLNASNQDLFIFHDSQKADDIVYDPSWAYQNEPSYTEMIGKFVVEKNTVKDGIHALRLNWESYEGGDWGGCIARDAWEAFDMDRYSHLSLWINTKGSLSKDLLPSVKFESTSGQKTATLKLGPYIDGTLPADTWVEVLIPTADFKAGTADFAWGNTKSLFFNQDATDAKEHTIYLDEIKMIFSEDYVAPTELIVFDNSADDTFHDQSWLNVSAPSKLGMAVDNNEKFAVSSTVAREGNSLNLSWTSATGGNWMALCAGKGWPVFDLTIMENLSMWIYSENAIKASELPAINFEAHSGGQTEKISLEEYTSDIAARSWTEITIPVSDIIEGSPAFTKFSNIKGIFFHQNKADNKAHSIYIDDIRFYNSTANSIDKVEGVEETSIYYADGFIYANAESAQVFDMAARKVADVKLVDSKAALKLSKGIYIVYTNQGASKITVK